MPENATFDASTQVFDWTPSEDQKGTHSVKFNVTDEEGANDSMTVSITVTDSSSDTSSTSGGSSGGGGGGGSQTTGEAYENIEFKDYTLKPVVKDRETMFEFSREDNSIISVSFTTSINGGQTKTIIEVLKDTSTLVKSAPSGKVYRNLNIWVGDGKLIPRLISDAQIVFKVEKSWIESRGVDADSIKLLRYSGSSWTQLPTSQTGENDEYFFYVAETPGFSPFAISSITEEITSVEASEEKTESVSGGSDVKKSVDEKAEPESNVATQEEKSSTFIWVTLVLAGVVFIGLLGYRNKEYCEECYERVRSRVSNHDGKRYRRIKR
ncbi:PGF-pre-PGF domain-containing protein [Methanolobus zinderi]|uniref:PGF-pre-PGF domain-containing protein n=1 Tax=Methanolobus zinderi TaxID=536044 RepID=A0A7D5I3W7_9EURY|nr:PGF-pre-PGF domain-containing protein [Methanolobus zinderi]